MQGSDPFHARAREDAEPPKKAAQRFKEYRKFWEGSLGLTNAPSLNANETNTDINIE
jgi:hypothetical protein